MTKPFQSLAIVLAVSSIGTAAVAQHASSHAAMDMPAMQRMMQEMMPSPADAASTKAFKEAH